MHRYCTGNANDTPRACLVSGHGLYVQSLLAVDAPEGVAHSDDAGAGLVEELSSDASDVAETLDD